MNCATIYIHETEIAKFMNDTKPKSCYVYQDGDYWAFEYNSEDDYMTALKWEYTYIPMLYDFGEVFYHTYSDSFAFEEYKTHTSHTGFNNPDEAEEALYNFIESNQ